MGTCSTITNINGSLKRRRVLLINWVHNNHCGHLTFILSNDNDDSLNTFVLTIKNCAAPLFLQQLGCISRQLSNMVESGRKQGNAPLFIERFETPSIHVKTCIGEINLIKIG